MSKQPIRWIVCGLGNISNSWLRVLSMSEDAKPVAFVDPDKNAWAKLKDWGFGDAIKDGKVFYQLEDAYKAVEADGTLILTPPQYHARYIIEAIENLQHVITEKPFCTETNQLRHIFAKYKEIALENNLICVVNQQYRYMERIEAIKTALRSGKIGKPGFVVSHFNEPDYHFNLWWRQQQQDISFANWFIHHIDTMRYILGPSPEKATIPKYVYANLFRLPWTKITGESSIFLQVEFENGVQWSYDASQEARGKGSPGQSEFIIHCQNGTIENPREGNPVMYIGGAGGDNAKPETIAEKDFEDIGFKYPPSWDHTMALAVESIRSGKVHPRLTNFEDNLFSIGIMFCARQSAMTGRKVDFRKFIGQFVPEEFLKPKSD